MSGSEMIGFSPMMYMPRTPLSSFTISVTISPSLSERNPGDLRRDLRRQGPHGLPHRVKPVRTRRNERLVFESPGDDVIEHRAEQRHVRAGLHLEMDIGSPGELGAAGIGDDQRGAAYVRALDRR